MASIIESGFESHFKEQHMPASRTIRIGAVSYLNSKPLIEGLDEATPHADLLLDYPSCLADQLAAGDLDVGLIPSVEYFRNPGHEVVSNACVATHGAVLSVKMYSRVRPGRIKTLALDAGSRTSATLVQIILHEKYGVKPKLLPLSMQHTTIDTDADAILLIGDRAMHPPAETFVETWDLGEEWMNWTGLPFVFAMWVVRSEFDGRAIEQALCEARDRGIASLERIAFREAAALGIDEGAAFDYLYNNLHFTLGAAERHGLRLFYELAAKQGLVPEGVDLVFRDYART